jgi:hypothetical protein
LLIHIEIAAVKVQHNSLVAFVRAMSPEHTLILNYWLN